MHNNAHPKRAIFWKCLIATIAITLGISSNTEARVTREVAEATIIYLLEAVGIQPHNAANPNDPIDVARRNAIVHMLYTDAGQREIWDWAVNNTHPVNLAAPPALPIAAAPFHGIWPITSSNVIRNPLVPVDANNGLDFR